MSWTDDRIDTLKKLWNDGESASAIAHALGQVTRNAVIGKVHRLGLAGRVSRSRARKATPIAFLFSPKLRSRKTQRLRSSSPAPATTRLPRCSIAFQRRIAPELGPPPDLPVTVQSLTESNLPLAGRRPETRRLPFLRPDQRRDRRSLLRPSRRNRLPLTPHLLPLPPFSERSHHDTPSPRGGGNRAPADP